MDSERESRNSRQAGFSIVEHQNCSAPLSCDRESQNGLFQREDPANALRPRQVPIVEVRQVGVLPKSSGKHTGTSLPTTERIPMRCNGNTYGIQPYPLYGVHYRVGGRVNSRERVGEFVDYIGEGPVRGNG